MGISKKRVVESHRFCRLGESEGFTFSDKFNLILVETKTGKQRLIWRAISDMELHEQILEPGSLEAIANQFLLWAESTISL